MDSLRAGRGVYRITAWRVEGWSCAMSRARIRSRIAHEMGRGAGLEKILVVTLDKAGNKCKLKVVRVVL